jgi:iron(III) transport system permease protein
VLVFGVIGIILIIWVFRTLETEFTSLSIQRLKEVGFLVSKSVPEEDYETWISSIRSQYPDILPYIIIGNTTFGEETQPVILNEQDRLFFDWVRSLSFYEYGLESTYYEEVYFYPQQLQWEQKKYYVSFIPVIPEEMGYVTGTLVLMHDAEVIYRYRNLLTGFAIALIVILLCILLVNAFSKDPVLIYTILIVFVIVGVFIAFPLYQAFRLTVLKDGVFSFDVWVKVLQTKNYLDALWGSILLGILTATVSTVIGFLFAFTLTRTDVKAKKFFSTMATLPVISPPFSLTLSLILLFGSYGLITRRLLGLTNVDIYGLDGLVLVQTMGMFPIAFMVLSGVLEAIDSTYEEAAMNLKASRWKVFSTVTLPLSFPGIASAWLLVFTNSIADFANPLILAGKYKVLSVEAYMEVTGMNHLDIGAALSILLLIPTLLAFGLQRYWISKKSFVTVTGKPTGRILEVVSPGVKKVLVVGMSTISIFLLSLYATIVAGCFVKNWGIDYSFTMDNIIEALQRGADAIADTTLLSAAATPIAGILAMIIAMIIVRKKFIGKGIMQSLVMIPYAVPGTLIGISFIIAFNKPPILLVGTAAIIIINYVIRELPVGVEGGIATLRQIDPSIEEAAQSLGADTATVFRTIVLPLIRPAFISSLSYTFVRSMTAVSAVIFLISAKWYHITILIYNFSENLRFGLASVLATTLMVIVLIVFGGLQYLIGKSSSLQKNIISR